jgi:hypothetical protein
MTNQTVKVDYVHWKDHEGARVLGICPYSPPRPIGTWSQIMGVIARSEGKFDSFVNFDQTAGTFGFLQWTFTSGRLSRLLESFKTILVEHDDLQSTLYDDLKLQDAFSKFGFSISSGKFYDISKKQILNPAFPSQKQRMISICSSTKDTSLQIAKLFGTIGQDPRVQMAEIAFGKSELIHSLDPVRNPLGEYKTIRNLLNDDWTTLSPPLFFNLFQNSPAAAFKLFINARKESDANATSLFDVAWRMVNRSSFGNWGWGSGGKAPRVTRIRDAIKEFYGIDLLYNKP